VARCDRLYCSTSLTGDTVGVASGVVLCSGRPARPRRPGGSSGLQKKKVMALGLLGEGVRAYLVESVPAHAPCRRGVVAPRTFRTPVGGHGGARRVQREGPAARERPTAGWQCTGA